MSEPRTLATLFDELDRSLLSGTASRLVPLATGFRPLDKVLGGGIRPGELVLLGGAPGVGKTIVGLQWARNIADAGHSALYVCYEHEEVDLLLRLLAMEVGTMPGADDSEVERLRVRIGAAAAAGGGGLGEVLEAEAVARRAYERVESYAERLWLLRASGAHVGVPQLTDIIAARQPSAVFVDYLQKVAVHPEPPTEAEKVTRSAEGLKDLALAHGVPIVCVVASDQDGLRSRRLRLHHFRGSSALAFEADVAIVLNDKFSAVSKVHLAYDPVRAATFGGWAVFSVEKNRGGPNLVDLEHAKDFAHFRFDPAGRLVAERLVDERIEAE